MNILHLSDIHFGREIDPCYMDECTRSNEIRRSLLETICSLDTDTRPEYVLVTGDIAWTAKREEFAHAIVWFRELLTRLNISSDKVAICPGNHDVYWNAGVPIEKKHYYSVQELDEIYRYDKIASYDNQVQYYNEFCSELDIIPYQYGEGPDGFQYSYCVGYRDIGQLRIVSFNSGIMSKILKDTPDKMWLGNTEVEELYKMGVYHTEKMVGKYIISIFHHAPRYLDPRAVFQYGDSRSTVLDIINGSDLTLCGHTETGALPFIEEYHNHGKLLNGGAAYYSDAHRNSFSIIKLNEDRDVHVISFQHIEHSGWMRITETDYNNLSYRIEAQDIDTGTGDWFNVTIDEKVLQLGPRLIPHCILVLECDGDVMPIPIGCAKFIPRPEPKDKVTFVMGNELDVARNIGFRCVGVVGGRINISIAYPKGRKTSVEVALCVEGYFLFMQKAQKKKQQVRMEIRITDGHLFMAAQDISDIKIDYDPDIETKIAYLKVMREFEQVYGVLFSVDFDLGLRGDFIDLMSKILRHEVIEVSDGGEIRIPIALDTLDKLNDLLEASETELPIRLLCEDQCVFHYGGVDVKIKDMLVITDRLRVEDTDDLKRKIETYCDKDQRWIVLVPKNRFSFMFVYDDNALLKEKACMMRVKSELLEQIVIMDGLLDWKC